jgi:hypothetical protein
MADEPNTELPSTAIDLRPKKGKPTDDQKAEALAAVGAPTSADAPGARIVEERLVRENEDLPALRTEAVEAAAKRALAAGLTSFTCEYTETGPTTFQVEAKRIG